MYNKHFGLSESPFNITPNSRFYFRTQSCDEILKIVQHGIALRKGVIVITGEPGTGKTLLVRFLEHDLAPRVKTVVVQNPRSDFDTMLEVLLTRLELHSEAGDRTARLDRLTCHLIEQHSQGVIICLLVDEAQDLDAHTLDELRLLANLEFQGDALLPIVLIGQPELNLKLDHSSATRIKQRIALTRTTHPLIRMEVGPYIRSRLQVAGYEGSGLFDPEAIDTIAAYSGGIPRLVNSICDNSLIRGYAGNKNVISAEIIDQAARDLRISASLPFGRPFTRAELVAITRASPTAEGAADAPERPLAGEGEQPAAQFVRVGLGDAGTAHLTDRQDIPAHLAANTARNMMAPKRRVPDATGDVSGPPPLDAGSEISRQGLPPHPRWYGVAAAIGLVLLLLNIVGSSQLAVLYSPAPRAQEPTAAASSYSARGGEETHGDGFREALFVSPSSSMTVAPRRIDITSSQPREDSAGGRTRVPKSANGKKVGPAKASPSQLPREGEPRRTEAADLAAANPKRSEDAPKTVRVIAASLLRKRPSASAEIISTLEPGSRVSVLARAGDFYQIRSLDKDPIRGYVHREDAFFERKK